jgi:hypothetical protein
MDLDCLDEDGMKREGRKKSESERRDVVVLFIHLWKPDNGSAK